MTNTTTSKDLPTSERMKNGGDYLAKQAAAKYFFQENIRFIPFGIDSKIERPWELSDKTRNAPDYLVIQPNLKIMLCELKGCAGDILNIKAKQIPLYCEWDKETPLMMFLNKSDTSQVAYIPFGEFMKNIYNLKFVNDEKMGMIYKIPTKDITWESLNNS